MVTWVWTRVEITSAVERRYREGKSRQSRRDLLTRLETLAAQWDEITDAITVRKYAELLARVIVCVQPTPRNWVPRLSIARVISGERFACLDRRLAEAAELEGFAVLGQEA